MIVKSLDHLEQVRTRSPLVTDDDAAQPGIVDGAVIETAGNIRAHAGLPGLQHDRPNAPDPGLLFLDKRVELLLSWIECEWLKRSGLGAEFQCGLSKIREIRAKARRVSALANEIIEPHFLVNRRKERSNEAF
jgi:hypothetical protein